MAAASCWCFYLTIHSSEIPQMSCTTFFFICNLIKIRFSLNCLKSIWLLAISWSIGFTGTLSTDTGFWVVLTKGSPTLRVTWPPWLTWCSDEGQVGKHFKAPHPSPSRQCPNLTQRMSPGTANAIPDKDMTTGRYGPKKGGTQLSQGRQHSLLLKRR